jgi:hypothetical protein
LLLRLLIDAIENDRYPLSPRIRLLCGIRAKVPMAPPDPPTARPPAPEEREPRRAPRSLFKLVPIMLAEHFDR